MNGNRTTDEVQVRDDGLYVSLKPAETAIAQFWASRYGAKTMMECMSDAGHIMLVELGDGCPIELGGEQYRDGPRVWAVPSTVMGAFDEGYRIQQLVSTTSAVEYGVLRQELSQAGYPDHVLNTIPRPQ